PLLFFLTAPPPPRTYPLSLHDALPILVFGAPDPKAGAFGSLYNLATDPRLGRELAVTQGVLADEAAALLVQFFEDRRLHERSPRSEEHTSELQSRRDLVCRLLLEKKNN